MILNIIKRKGNAKETDKMLLEATQLLLKNTTKIFNYPIISSIYYFLKITLASSDHVALLLTVQSTDQDIQHMALCLQISAISMKCAEVRLLQSWGSPDLPVRRKHRAAVLQLSWQGSDMWPLWLRYQKCWKARSSWRKLLISPSQSAGSADFNP